MKNIKLHARGNIFHAPEKIYYAAKQELLEVKDIDVRKWKKCVSIGKILFSAKAHVYSKYLYI
jgi:hypothetical protein